jgi:Alpha-2,8-polysialyltransferase (POLYST)
MRSGKGSMRLAVSATEVSGRVGDSIDLFVIETPLQLLNALEAHYFFKSRKSTLLIIFRESYSRLRFENLLSELPENPWTEIRFVRMKTRFEEIAAESDGKGIFANMVGKYIEFHRLLNRKRIDAQLASIPAGTRVFLGNYEDFSKAHFRHIANATKASQIILLDDGTAAILVNEQRIAWVKSKEDPLPLFTIGSLHWFGRLKRLLRKRYLDWDDRHCSSVTFFSAFALATSNVDRLIRNEYHFLRSIRKAQGASDEIYILGQSLSEDGYLDREQYVRSVVGLCRNFTGQQIVYVPHPREIESTIEGVLKATGAKVRRLEVPIEFALLTVPELPRAVASFCSTALVNCSLIFGHSLKIYGCRLDLGLLRHNRSEVAGIYESLIAMQSANFHVLNQMPGVYETKGDGGKAL